MGLIFVPYIHETLRSNFQRVSSESTSEGRSLPRGSNSNETSYQSLEDLVRIYDNPDTPEADNLDDSGSNLEGQTQPSDSNSPATERNARVQNDHTFFPPLRRPPIADLGSTAVSGIDRRTVRLLEVLSAYYVRSAYETVRAHNPTPPPPTASSSSAATSSPTPPSTSSLSGPSLLQSTPISSAIISRPALAVPARYAVRTRSSQTEELELSSRRPQFILRPDPNEMSPEELRLLPWLNGPLTFHSNNNDDPDSSAGRLRLGNQGPRLLRAPNLRTDDDLLPLVRRGTEHSSSASSSGSEDPWRSSGGLLRYSSNTDQESESAENTPQASLWHNETRTNVTTHGCLRIIMRSHRGWAEQAPQNDFVEYWHYTTVPRREARGFEVVRDGVARLPWPMLAFAGLQTLRTFAHQINSVHHRDNSLTDYQGNVFDVILVPSLNTPGVDN